MSALRRALHKLRATGAIKENTRSRSAPPINEKLNGDLSSGQSASSLQSKSSGEEKNQVSRNQARKQERREQKETRVILNERRELEREEKRKMEAALAAKLEPDELQQRYGVLPINQSQERKNETRSKIANITAAHEGEEVTLRVRVHTIRKLSSGLAFFIFRQKEFTIQGVLEEKESQASEYMIKWADHIGVESVVLVKGTIRKAAQTVKAATIHDQEILIREFHAISEVTEDLPFTVYEAEISKQDSEKETSRGHHINTRTLLSNRVLDLRTAPSQALFRINAGICNLFRTFLDSQGFIEIHTPKLQGAATESGASVFKVKYFDRDAFLAQSPQLAKQMSVIADFERVYEIGPVFRAEDSNTHRHLTEFTGLDLEMAFEEHYHEVLDMIDNMFKSIFKGIYERYRHELDTVKQQFPHEDLVWLDKTPRIPFKEGIKMLRDAGYKEEDGSIPHEHEDLSTRAEIRLGGLIKEKYGTDFYIIDKFPLSARPFYTMLDPEDPHYTNSFDIFLRGQEILSGGQRIHNPEMLKERMLDKSIQPATMKDYLEGFTYGAPPHGGGGVGLERVVMLLLNLGDVRHASLFHRDPRSLPKQPPVSVLRHPEASTLNPPWKNKPAFIEDVPTKELQPLTKLIANYGDASNTSWLDDRYRVWRDDDTGAACGYVPQDHYAIIIGDPLCDRSQYELIMRKFIKFIKDELELKPIWLLVGKDGEEVLGGKFGWSTLSCTAEERVDPSVDPAAEDDNVARKIRHAKKEGIKISDVPPGQVTPEIKAKCDQRMQDWMNNRKGTQVHLTELNPWVDWEHRRYFYATDKDENVHALLVLAQLSHEHGYQVKYALEFPGAPSGTSEYIITHALHNAASAGAKSVTFGGSATTGLSGGHHMGGLRMKFLAKSYQSIVSSLRLINKSEFRQKLGAEEDPIYICFPKNGLGPRGIRAIMKFFSSEGAVSEEESPKNGSPFASPRNSLGSPPKSPPRIKSPKGSVNGKPNGVKNGGSHSPPKSPLFSKISKKSPTSSPRNSFTKNRISVGSF
ncbi:hypothetical protein AOL_s00076g658 [Orbilia oligospora ATCC 24927]|uniref:aspartate--tRNA ligase n=1 Tax=Arthrobotrys oligospora (strain ATCC 24927 / CBS 115.81 / DSM 1491) TaxID=756982 RepID=G1XAK0_ARTOA|nr:hypothetical protein AOL_s00076g658 [Orbilia oligospora ATCC 24927]EGX49774.1 hypothetical protein AOL_s00076g658 [Orbilia oligospora ATCC 24927]